MQRINYHHLYYFWTVVKEGGIARASEKLHLTQPTISSQITQFEQTIGHALFDRAGRSLLLTDTGRDVFDYAEEIFSIGRELTQYLSGRAMGKGYRLNVGIADMLPKLVVMELLKPALHLDIPVKLFCHEDKPDRLVKELELHALDLVLTTGPLAIKPASGIFSHFLAESPMVVFGTTDLVDAYRKGFPHSLNGAPFLMPAGQLGLRQDVDRWCEEMEIWPEIRAEISDSALLKTFGAEGIGFFLAPRMVQDVITKQYGVDALGVIEGIREKFYLLSAQRKVNHPALMAILDHAKDISDDRFNLSGI
ncbi:MAG TPA: LysR family transcriptional regulator [Methylococcaceae bacterium]|jgi:LysR family transcriptional activator of nhaA|nr:LysR family transcriptional regulator [Methylococcaceae bacterium]